MVAPATPKVSIRCLQDLVVGEYGRGSARVHINQGLLVDGLPRNEVAFSNRSQISTNQTLVRIPNAQL